MQHGRCITFKEENNMVVQHNMTAANANRMLGITTSAQQNLQRSYLLVTKSTVQQMMQQD